MKVNYNKWVVNYHDKTSVFGTAFIEAAIYTAMLETIQDYTESDNKPNLMDRLTATSSRSKQNKETMLEMLKDRENSFWAEYNKATFWNLWNIAGEKDIIYVEGNK